MNFENRVAIITGGAAGIGKEITRALLDHKIQHVVIFDVNLIESKKTCDEFSMKYGNGRICNINVDIINENELKNAFLKIKKEFKKVDIFVNNAGIHDEIDLNLIMKVNLICPIKATEFAIHHLEPDGAILNIGSMSGFVPHYAAPYYAATKAGLISFTSSIAHPENVHGIRVQSLNPAFTNTTFLNNTDRIRPYAVESMKMMRIGNIQEPDTVGRAAVYVIKNGENGNIWTIHNGNLAKVTLPTASSDVVKTNI